MVTQQVSKQNQDFNLDFSPTPKGCQSLPGNQWGIVGEACQIQAGKQGFGDEAWGGQGPQCCMMP